MSTSEDVVRAYFDALNARDYEKAAALFSDDCEFVSVASGVQFTGTDSMLTGCASSPRRSPTGRRGGERHRLRPLRRDRVENHRHTGGHVPRRVPTGIRFRRDGCSVAEVEDGRIVRYRDYYDRATLLEQLGLPSVL